MKCRQLQYLPDMRCQQLLQIQPVESIKLALSHLRVYQLVKYAHSHPLVKSLVILYELVPQKCTLS